MSVECPAPDCSQRSDREEIFFHFTSQHRVFEQKYALLDFLEDDDVKSKYITSDYPSDPLLDPSEAESNLRTILSEHPIFEVEMYTAYFGSLDNALEEARMKVGRTDYSPFNSFMEKEDKERFLEVSNYDRELYGSNYPEKRRAAVERDDMECRICGKGYPEHAADLEVHHITPAREFHLDHSEPNYEAMNELSNLVTLCSSCHGTFEGRWEDTEHEKFVENAKQERLTTLT